MVKKYIRRFCLVLVSAFNISCIAALLRPDSDQSAFSYYAAPTSQHNTSERLVAFNNGRTNIKRRTVDTTWFYPAATDLAGSFPFNAVIIHDRADSIKVTDRQFHAITRDKGGD